MRIKKNDTVVVLSGKEKGKRGVVLVVDPKKDMIMVKGLAVATHHAKARRAGESSGIRKEEAFMSASKLMPVCPSCTKPCRVNSKLSDDKKNKVRICNRCQATL